MCREGGCGSCVINAEIFDYETKQPKYMSINTVNMGKIVENVYLHKT